jgi:hypothetical protein
MRLKHFTFVALLSLLVVASFFMAANVDSCDVNEQEGLIRSAIENYGNGNIDGVEIVIAPAWELECGGSCIHYGKKRIEVARGERWRQDLMHEVTHWLLYKDGHPPGTHHPIMYSKNLCYGGCDDVPQISKDFDL